MSHASLANVASEERPAVFRCSYGFNPAHRQSQKLNCLLQGGNINLAYQPQFDLATGKLRGVEALLRVVNLAGQRLNPAELVATAERNGVIAELGLQITGRAMHDYAAMRAVGSKLGRIAINVSPLELRRADFAEQVINSVHASGLDFADVELEIIESWPLDDPSLDLRQLDALSEMGISIALDDFGSGHANWVSAVKLPLSTLKIDRSLIMDMSRNATAHAAVRSICRASEELGLNVVAEGINNQVQREMLIEMGCGSGQGFALAMPLPPAEVMDVRPLTFVCSADSVVL